MKKVLVALLMFVGSEAKAHDFWADGEPVPAWVKSTCCGQADAHHIKAEHVHVTSQGWRIDGYPEVVPFYRALPSQDGEFWAFWSIESDGSPSMIWCFFAPSESF
jgi:hypothetical protein